MLGENYRPKVWSFGLNIYRLFVLNKNRLFIKYSLKLYITTCRKLKGLI